MSPLSQRQNNVGFPPFLAAGLARQFGPWNNAAADVSFMSGDGRECITGSPLTGVGGA